MALKSLSEINPLTCATRVFVASLACTSFVSAQQPVVNPNATQAYAQQVQAVPIYPSAPQVMMQPMPANVVYGNAYQAPQAAPQYMQAPYPQYVMPQNMVYAQTPVMMQPQMIMQPPQPVMIMQQPSPQPMVMYAYPVQAQGGMVMVNGVAAMPMTATQVPVSQLTNTQRVDGQSVVLQPSYGNPVPNTGTVTKPNSFPSNAPIASLNAADIALTNTSNVESLLNTLPQIRPGFDRTSNLGDGRANVDLRGMDSENTLVLLNGQRFVPATANGIVDLNSIPTSMIERIDVLSGGASAAYGSGAVAGVVNVVLRDDFEGAKFEAQHQTDVDGAAAMSSGSLTLGGGFDEGRGNITVNVSVSEREALTSDQRDFSAFARFDDLDANGNPVLINGGSSGVPQTAIFSGGLGTISPTFGVLFEEDGSLRPFEVDGKNNDFYNFAAPAYLQVPQKREQFTLSTNYQATDAIGFYGLGTHTSSDTTRQFAPFPFFGSASFVLDGNPFLPQTTQQQLSDALGFESDVDGDGIGDSTSAFLRRRLVELGPRQIELKSTTEQFQAGVRGSLGGLLEYDVYASEGVVQEQTNYSGAYSSDRLTQALLVDLDASPDGTICQDTSPGPNGERCAPANIFGAGNLSDDAARFISANLSAEAEYRQSVQGAKLTTSLDVMQGGAARLTVGGERRKERYAIEYDANGDELSAVTGFNFSGPYEGTRISEELYSELYLPLLANLPGAELVDLELGYRLSDYENSKGVQSIKAAASWAPTEFLRVRGSYNQSHRAPSIQDMFEARIKTAVGGVDPCSANGFPSAEVAALCVATGVPENLVGNAGLNLPGGVIRTLNEGNPNLLVENAESLTAGVALTLPLGEASQIYLGADGFKFEGTDVIRKLGGGSNFVLQQCYDPNQSSPDALSPFCNGIDRTDKGQLLSLSVGPQNIASYTVEGMDVSAGLSINSAVGDLAVDYLGTILATKDFTPFEGAETLECAGRFGNRCGQPSPEYKHRLSAGWSGDNLGAALVWRHLGKSGDDDDTTDFTREEIEARDYLDAQVMLSVADKIELALGVQNITDTQPPIMGDNQGEANTFPGTYDTFGRTYFVRLTGASSLRAP